MRGEENRTKFSFPLNPNPLRILVLLTNLYTYDDAGKLSRKRIKIKVAKTKAKKEDERRERRKQTFSRRFS
jgi:hypothetical protein